MKVGVLRGSWDFGAELIAERQAARSTAFHLIVHTSTLHQSPPTHTHKPACTGVGYTRTSGSTTGGCTARMLTG